MPLIQRLPVQPVGGILVMTIQKHVVATMRPFRTNNHLFILAAAAVTAAPFAGLAWRAQQWLGW
ncbi:hypothetical protein A9K66_25615 [Mesorhizobium sp. AA23]|nr:hypothetical protein A9K66_25615 [Mesorhizobium sp. AA23]